MQQNAGTEPAGGLPTQRGQPAASNPGGMGSQDPWMPGANFRIRVPEPGWRAGAACTPQNSHLFVGELTRGQETAAKAICTGCGVRDECLAFSLAHGVRYGVWGGFNEGERMRMRQIWLDQRAAGVLGARAHTA